MHKLEVKLQFLEPSARIIEIAKSKSSPPPLVMTLYWQGSKGYQNLSA